MGIAVRAVGYVGKGPWCMTTDPDVEYERCYYDCEYLNVTALQSSMKNYGAKNFTTFDQYKLKFNKHYSNKSEEFMRFAKFAENHEWVTAHNEMYTNGSVMFYARLNEDADMMEHELTMRQGLQANHENSLSDKMALPHVPFFPSIAARPARFDWREYGTVTSVKNQGSCGACYAFAAIGSLEAQRKLHTGKLESLSAQNLVDCSGEYGNSGCNGGLMTQAYNYIMHQGLQSAATYAYEAKKSKCHFNKTQSNTRVQAFFRIPRGDEELLRDAVASVGPVAVGIDASQKSFQFYSGGIYYEPKCVSDRMNHAVLIVGYGTEGEQDYWIVKNSYGTRWGQQGYIKMARNKNNNCGIATLASYPLSHPY